MQNFSPSVYGYPDIQLGIFSTHYSVIFVFIAIVSGHQAFFSIYIFLFLLYIISEIFLFFYYFIFLTFKVALDTQDVDRRFNQTVC